MRVPPVIYLSCPPPVPFFLSVSPASLPSRAAAAISSRRHYTSPLSTAAPSPTPLLTTTVANRHSKPPPRVLALAQRHPRAPASPARASVLLRRPHVSPSSSAAVHPRLQASTPQPQSPRLQASTPFTPQPQPITARQVLDRLSEQDGPREEEGEGGRCREACSQADSCRGGREGRDGGQGRRGAGIRPCSSVPDQGGPKKQRQRQRQGYGQSQRCLGHQSRDSSSSDRFRWF